MPEEKMVYMCKDGKQFFSSIEACKHEQFIIVVREKKKLLEEFTTGVMVTKMDNIDKIVTFNRNLFSTIGVVVIVAFVVIKALGM